MLSVYDRILKLANNASMGDRYRIAYTAILNLTSIEDIRSFTNDLIRQYPITGKEDIRYMLCFFDIEDRKLWKSAIGDIIPIEVLYNRCERELYKYFKFVDDNGNDLEYYYNEEKGNHQSR